MSVSKQKVKKKYHLVQAVLSLTKTVVLF